MTMQMSGAVARFGVIGEPSDWLVASKVDYELVKERLNVELVDIASEELLGEIAKPSSVPMDEEMERVKKVLGGAQDVENGMCIPPSVVDGAVGIYFALKRIVARYELTGFTIRCFDLLGTVKNTSCLALGLLNSEGIVAACEGDVAALLTMHIANMLAGTPGFMANPASIDQKAKTVVLSHCTVPLNMVSAYQWTTHHESGLGMAIKGTIPAGPMTLMKLSPDLDNLFFGEGEVLENLNSACMCRTQIRIRLDDKDDITYLLTAPFGNHHIVVPGHVGKAVQEFFQILSPHCDSDDECCGCCEDHDHEHEHGHEDGCHCRH